MEFNLLSFLIGLGTIVIGWLLAIWGNVINENIKRRSTKNDVKVGIISELKELQIYLSSVCLMSTCAVGNYNREFYDWLKPHLLKILESVEFMIPQNLKDTLPKFSEIEDDILFQLISVAFVKNPNENRPTSFTYKSIATPYIDLKISDISLFSTNIQKAIFTLKRDMNFLNNDVTQVWFYHSKTFDNPTSGNYQIIQANLMSLYARIARRSKIMVDKIEENISLFS